MTTFGVTTRVYFANSFNDQYEYTPPEFPKDGDSNTIWYSK